MKLIAPLLLLFSSYTFAFEWNRFELGVMVGEPSGISGKYWLNQYDAIDAAAGWSFTDDVIDLAVDYQRHFYLLDIEKGELPFYIGLGAGLQLGNKEDDDNDDDAFFGFRIPVGLTYLFEEAPLSIFAEVAPIIEVIPETDFRLTGGIGIRFRFGKM
jgi:hypothetical protein